LGDVPAFAGSALNQITGSYSSTRHTHSCWRAD
jgi:hypothetical protein